MNQVVKTVEIEFLDELLSEGDSPDRVPEIVKWRRPQGDTCVYFSKYMYN